MSMTAVQEDVRKENCRRWATALGGAAARAPADLPVVVRLPGADDGAAAVFVVYPIIASLGYTFSTSGTGSAIRRTSSGSATSARSSTTASFWRSLGHTFVYAAFVVPIQLVLALALALVLNSKRLRFASFYRTLFFLPVVTVGLGVVIQLLVSNFGDSINGPVAEAAPDPTNTSTGLGGSARRAWRSSSWSGSGTHVRLQPGVLPGRLQTIPTSCTKRRGWTAPGRCGPSVHHHPDAAGGRCGDRDPGGDRDVTRSSTWS
jgi:hypothetical protein